MDIPIELETALRDVALGGLRFQPSTGSTNDDALAWAACGATDFSLVVADTQTNGRGRDGRKWFSPEGACLAFSLVLRPTKSEREQVSRFSGLGALALTGVLRRMNLPAEVKWPNDVLIRRRKAAGILVEAAWLGADVESLVLGMGVNITRESLPPAEVLNYPGTCLEAEAGLSLNRFEILRKMLVEIRLLREGMLNNVFMQEWNYVLAFRGERVQLWQGNAQPFEAEVIGLEADGSLKVSLPGGETRLLNFGEVHLRAGDG